MHQSVALWIELRTHDEAVEKQVAPIDGSPHLLIDARAYTRIKEYQIVITLNQNTEDGKLYALHARALNKKALCYMSEPGC